MKYAILVYETAAEFAKREDHEETEEYWETWGAYSAYLGDRLVGGQILHDSALATTVRLRDGERHVEDGPFADTKEQLGGLFIVEAEDLDEALALAARCPCASHGSAEVRPLFQAPGSAEA